MRKSYKFAKKKKFDVIKYRANFNIKTPELQVIDSEGKLLGVMPTNEAIKLAQEAGYDLVEVSPKANPPVAKFLDFGKFQYQQEKLQKKQNKAKKVGTKCSRLSVKISDHDLEVRANQARNFLKDGQKVKIELQLRGRENQHPELGKEVIKKFIDKLQFPYKVEQDITKLDNKIFMIIYPGSNNSN